MKLFLLSSVLLLQVLPTFASTKDESSRYEYINNHRKLLLVDEVYDGSQINFLVKVKDEYSIFNILSDTSSNVDTNTLESLLLKIKNELYRDNLIVFEDIDPTELSALLDSSETEWVEPDYIVYPDAIQSSAPWHLDRIDYPQGNLDTKYQYQYSGKGVKIFVLDTGCRTSHGEFSSRASCGFDSFGTGCEDSYNHGTHVAGICGGSTYGVAKDAELVCVKVLGGPDGEGSVSSVIEGIDYVREQKESNPNQPMIINLSMGTGLSQSMNQAVNDAVSEGIIVVASAGNKDKDACTQSPGSAQSAVTVASITQSNSRSSFSKYGSCVDIFAPGSSISSSSSSSDSATRSMSGTSQSSPVVAGVAAQYLEKYPTLSTNEITNMIYEDGIEGIVSGSNGSPDLVVSIEKLNGATGGTTGGTSPTDPKTGESDGDTRSCFSKYNTIDVLGKGIIYMNELHIGDYVKVDDEKNKYSRIYSFSHLNHNAEATYMQIHTNNNQQPLEISENHMLYINNSKNIVPAKHVQIGDILISDENNDNTTNFVTDIQYMKRRGLYAPITESGTLLVSGIKVSSYVVLMESSTAQIQNMLSHASLAPLRVACWLDFTICNNETYDNNTGLSNYLIGIIDIIFYIRNNFNYHIQVILTMIATPIMLGLYVLEQMIMNRITSLILLVSTYIFYQQQRKQKKSSINKNI